MPLRLKQLNLHGYKTFATKSEFTFGAGVSAIVGPNGSGKCVSGDTLVTLADGRDVLIRELVEAALSNANTVEKLSDGTLTRENPHDVQILTLNLQTLRLEPRSVAGFVKRQAPSRLLRVRTRSGREVMATPYHPFFTLEAGRLRALKAEKLEAGVRLALPRQLPVSSDQVELPPFEVLTQFRDEDRIYVPNSESLRAWADTARARFGTWVGWRKAANVPDTQFSGLLNEQAVNAAVLVRLAQTAELHPPLDGHLKCVHTSEQTRVPAVFTPDLARFLGLLAAEGRNNELQIWFVNSDPALNDEFTRLAQALFGVAVSRKHYKPNAEDLLIYSRPLAMVLERLFNFQVKSVSAEKEMPPQLLHADTETQWAFLSGLFEGDAYLCVKPRINGKRAQAYIEYVSASPKLARQVVALLLRLGVFAMLHAKRKAASNTVEKRRRTYYSVLIYGTEQLRHTARRLSFVGKKAQALTALRELDSTSNPNLDLVPGVTPLVKEAARLAGVKIKTNRRNHPKLAAYVENRCEASRSGLLEVIGQIEQLGTTPKLACEALSQLSRLATSDIYWDEIVSIEQVEPRDEWVYDLSITDTHNFVAGNIIVHNSNIVDSIRWVLGEQSFGLLRGKKTEDMIFAGSEQRPRAGMAEAALTFDNSDGWLPIDFSEVTIARRAYRDGENEYLLNGQRVRLRDISELLARCGLSERTYTIIGQGLIDTALSLKAEERRALFEEAAGIGVYRNKREDALKKLETTQRNLERVLDILAEIKPRLRSLERQAQRARDFNQVKADLDAILKIWYGYHWHRAVESVETARLEAELTQGELTDLRSKQEGYDQEVAGLRTRVSALRGQLNTWRGESNRLNAARESLARELAVAGERLRSLAAQRDSLLAELTPLEAQLDEQTERAAAALAEVTRLDAEAEEARRQLESAQAALVQRDAQRAALQQRESEARAALARLDSQLAELRAREGQRRERRERLAATLAGQRAEFETQLAAEEAARARAGQANAALNTLQSARAEAEVGTAAQTEAIRQAEADLAGATERAAAARAEVERLHARQEVLDQARAELAGFASGAKALLSKNFPTRGAFAELLAVPAELETAISAALGAYLEALVVNDYGETDAAIAALGEANGRAAFLPLQHLSAPEPLAAPDDPDVLGVAARLVAVDDSLRPAVNLLLGQTIVVRDRAAATRFLQSAIHNLQSAILVTLNGEVYHASGPVTAGRDSAPTTLQQARERRNLSVEIENARARSERQEVEREAAARSVAEARDKLVRLQAALKEAQAVERQATVARDSIGLEAERLSHNVQFHRQQLAALDAEIGQLDAEVNAAQEELARLAEARRAAEADMESARGAVTGFSAEELAAQAAHWQTQAAVAARAAQDAGARADDAGRSRAAAERLLNERRGRAEGLEAESQSVAQAAADQRQKAAAIEEQIAALDQQVLPTEQQLAELEAELTRVESGDTEARSTLHAAERRNAEAQLEFVRKSEELEGLRRRVEEDFGLVEFDYGDSVTGPTPLPLYPVVEKLERVEALPEGLEEQLNRKRGQLRRMGLINPDAEKEYLEVKERHDFLTTQVEDLQAAQTQLREVIAEMDVLMERDFRKTFDAVANEFKETFARLFGGGTAKLLLTDPDHLSTTGVDIQARLPGRRPQSLSMLSGGERSLTACALVFALLRVSPTPFCVLDEVDAMLDEANVGRYRDMLLDLSSATQFIIVTHNRNTVQAADTVYGVTMGADSASQVIGLKLDGERVGSADRAN